MTAVLTNLFDGVAYGMLLFVLACGLAVTLGLMNFVNLAHGSFAMAGGYVCAVMVNKAGWPFFLALPLAFVASALIGAAFERALYRHLYRRGPLDQVLLTVGLLFVATAVATYFFGSQQQPVAVPQMLRGRVDFLGVELDRKSVV